MIFLAALSSLWATPPAGADTPAPMHTPEQVAFYEKQVLPVLKEHCYKCHTGKKVRGGLSLESRAAVLKGGDLGPAVHLGKLSDSPLLKAIQYKDDGLRMPPAGRMPQGDIDVLVKWAEMGLPFTPGKEVIVKEPPRVVVTEKDREWWAYRPLRRPPVPAVKDTRWLASPIDAFLLAKLEEAGLRPSAPASRAALARRAYYGLTGLPPTPEQIDAFVADARPDAWERLVDALLAAPSHGEKMARHWLDLVRYAETHGYERDSAKPFAWRYRDWVIQAFNSNLPYDRLVKAQLAGDLLAPGDADALIATGYYRLGLWDDEPVDRLQARFDVLDGIVSTTGSVFLGMSVGCARCHDHKKDPIPQRDYYRLLAYFAGVTDMNRENLRRAPAGGPGREKLLRERQEREARLFLRAHALEQEALAEVAKRKGVDASAFVGSDLEGLTYRYYRDAWHELPDFAPLTPLHQGDLPAGLVTLDAAPEKERMALVFEGRLKAPAAGEYTFEVTSSDGARLVVDGKVVISRPGKGRATRTATARLRAGLLPFRLEYFHTAGAPVLNVTWCGSGFAKRPLSAAASSNTLLADARAGGATWRYLSGRIPPRWSDPAIDDTVWKSGKGGFGTRGTPGAIIGTEWKSQAIVLRTTVDLAQLPLRLMLDIHHDEDAEVAINGRVVFRGKGFLTEYRRVELGPEAVKALKPGRNLIAVTCRQTVGGQYIDVGLSGEGASVDEVIRTHASPEKARALAAVKAELAALRAEKLPEPYIDVMCVTEKPAGPTRVLTRGNPHAPGEEAPPGVPEVLGSEKPKGRAGLAEWIVGPKNPIAARVMANRVWQYHFGRGLVASSNDFGKLGDLPTHPELLDWLAAELVESGWDLKHLHRVILTSSAYRMSSAGSAEALARDGAGLLYWRFPMRRLSAEEVRDTILAVSGQLNRQMGGPPVYPPIPAAVLAGQSVPGAGWGKSTPEQAARRSIYVHVKRSLLLPILEAHDAADTDSSCAARYTTTVPTQALGMLNGDFTNEQARRLAARLTAEEASLEARVARAIRLTTGRVAKEDEAGRDVAFIRRLMKEDGLDEGRALASYCLLALNASEMIYLD
jgi:hypothetical protein